LTPSPSTPAAGHTTSRAMQRTKEMNINLGKMRTITRLRRMMNRKMKMRVKKSQRKIMMR
jgi:hypothetical protein